MAKPHRRLFGGVLESWTVTDHPLSLHSQPILTERKSADPFANFNPPTNRFLPFSCFNFFFFFFNLPFKCTTIKLLCEETRDFISQSTGNPTILIYNLQVPICFCFFVFFSCFMVFLCLFYCILLFISSSFILYCCKFVMRLIGKQTSKESSV